MISRIFYKEKPVHTLVSLVKKDRMWYPSMLCKEIDCTYPHMVNILKVFEAQGLIESESQGRIKIIRLTPMGEDIAHDFENTLRRFEKIELEGTYRTDEEEKPKKLKKNK